MSWALKLVNESFMSHGFQKLAEDEQEALRWILAAGPAGGGKQFSGARAQILKILIVTSRSTVGGGVEFKEDLVITADVANAEFGAVVAGGEAFDEAFGKTEFEEGII